MEEKKGKFIWIMAGIAVVLIAFLAYRGLHTATCTDISCFNSAMAKCQKASFINEAEDASWLYTITGKDGSFGCFLLNSRCNFCNINVKLLQAKEGASDIAEIEGLEMDCTLAFGYSGIPNADLTKCHGKLREAEQDLMIKKMHAYILSNIGKIGEELNKVV